VRRLYLRSSSSPTRRSTFTPVSELIPGAHKTGWGVGDFGAVQGIEESERISPYSATLILSGLDSTLVNEALSQDYFRRPITLYLGVANTNDVLLDDPTQIWAGFMDSMSLSVGSDGGDSIQLTCESELSMFDRSANLRYTDQFQQDQHTGDVFFEFLPAIADNPAIRWRNPNSDNLVGKNATDPLDIPNFDPEVCPF
jgi:hypothetical protein